MKLSRRERYSIYLMIGFVVIFIFFQYIAFPLMDKQERLKRNVASKTETLADMLLLKSEYEMLMKKVEFSKERFNKRERGFTLFSFLDRLAGQTGIKDNITYMKPSRADQKGSPYKISLVEMKIQGINLKQLTPYLYQIETSKNMVFIRRISILKAGKEEGFIDAVLQVETFEI
jgi:general secretion pathway protein M